MLNNLEIPNGTTDGKPEPRMKVEVKCSCGWQGFLEHLKTKYVGVALEQDVEGISTCPMCGNEDLEYLDVPIIKM